MAKKIILIAGIILILITIPVATYLVSQNQDNRQNADEGDPTATPTSTPSATLTPTGEACTPPAAPESVIVDYPLCDGSTCDLTQAMCTWEPVADAASYTVTVNQVEDGTVVKDHESIASDVLTVSFPIVQNKTYKCTVEAINACNASGPSATDQLLCVADALLETPTPTVPTTTTAPTPTTALTTTATPTMIMPPTNTPIPTSTPVPPIAQPGGTLETIGIIGGILLFVAGGAFLLLL